jgi:phosphoribosyl 1,2-cyclic phosphate phosphodiesterase
MKFIITGSGGCVSIPRALCQCKVCTEARQKGIPYARCGCSLYLKDISLLVDTPEDINIALNNANINSLDYILYSHWDPDHTLGMRIIEQLRLEWLEFYENIKPVNPITIYCSNGVMKDINGIRNTHGSFMDYYEYMGLIKREVVENKIDFNNDISITFIPIPKDKNVDVFLFEQNGKKLIYAPCDCKDFPENDNICNADILLIGNTFVGNILKNNTKIHEQHPLRKELHSMENILEIIKQYKIKNTIITHLEEDWGKSYDEYKNLEKDYENIKFAYDGMEIEL